MEYNAGSINEKLKPPPNDATVESLEDDSCKFDRATISPRPKQMSPCYAFPLAYVTGFIVVFRLIVRSRVLHQASNTHRNFIFHSTLETMNCYSNDFINLLAWVIHIFFFFTKNRKRCYYFLIRSIQSRSNLFVLFFPWVYIYLLSRNSDIRVFLYSSISVSFCVNSSVFFFFCLTHLFILFNFFLYIFTHFLFIFFIGHIGFSLYNMSKYITLIIIVKLKSQIFIRHFITRYFNNQS